MTPFEKYIQEVDKSRDQFNASGHTLRDHFIMQQAVSSTDYKFYSRYAMLMTPELIDLAADYTYKDRHKVLHAMDKRLWQEAFKRDGVPVTDERLLLAVIHNARELEDNLLDKI